MMNSRDVLPASLHDRPLQDVTDMQDEQQLPAMILSPKGPYRLGDAATAVWSMTNFADHDLAGATLTFSVPASVDVVLAESSVQGSGGDAISAAFTTEGFALGTVRRGDGVNAVLGLRFAREAVAPEAIVATLHLGSEGSFASEPAELVSRARALLAVSAMPHVCDVDGGRLGIAFAFENRGETRAQRVTLAVPAPQGFALARVRLADGSPVVPSKESFLLPDVPRSASVGIILEFERRGAERCGYVEIDGIALTYAGGALFLDPVTVPIDSAEPSLQAMLETATTTIEPGSVIRIDLNVANAGYGDARGVTVGFDLPQQLAYCAGTIAVNGGSDARRNDPRSIAVGTVLGRSSATVALYATAVAPLPHGDTFVVGASVDGRAVDPVAFAIKSEPAFPTGPNSFELEGSPTVGVGERRTVRVRAANVGTADARDVRVRLISPQLVIETASIVSSTGSRESAPMKSSVSREGQPCVAVDLGTVAARDIKTLEVDLRAPDHFGDGQVFPLRADLRFGDGAESDVGFVELVGRCRPEIATAESGLSSSRTEPLRIGHVRSYTLRVKNAGLAAARGVSVSLNLPGMLAIEAVNGTPTRSDVIAIREIPAGAAVEVPIALRLVESVDGGATLDISAVVGGEAISTVSLDTLRVVTTGRAYLDEFVTRIEDRSDERLATIRFRNVGDAIAQQVVIAAIDLPSAYVPGSTRLGDVPVPDFGGSSLLARGLTLPPLVPGREIVVAYRLNVDSFEDARVAFNVRSRTQNEMPEPATFRATRPPARAIEPAAFVPAAFEAFGEPMEAATFTPPAPPAPTPTFAAPARMDVPHFVTESPPPAPIPVPSLAASLASFAFGTTATTNGNGRSKGHTASTAVGVSPVTSAVAAAVDASLRSQGPAAGPRAHGLVGYLVMDRAEVERVRRIAETALAVPALGTYRHFFAMRALVPRSLLGASPDVAARWEAVHDRVRADLRAPFVQAAMPGFDARPEWANQFHDATSAEAASRAIVAIRQAGAENVSYDDVAAPDDWIRGSIGREFESYLSSMPEPTGNVLNLILAEAIPTESSRDQHLAKSLKRYRERLKLLFAALLYQNPSARHERMLSGLDVELDDTLRAIVDRLRDPRWA
jgi:hypothetical protein